MVVGGISEGLSEGLAPSRLDVFPPRPQLSEVFSIPPVSIEGEERVRPGRITSFSTCLSEAKILPGWARRVMVLKHGRFLSTGEFYPP